MKIQSSYPKNLRLRTGCWIRFVQIIYISRIYKDYQWNFVYNIQVKRSPFTSTLEQISLVVPRTLLFIFFLHYILLLCIPYTCDWSKGKSWENIVWFWVEPSSKISNTGVLMTLLVFHSHFIHIMIGESFIVFFSFSVIKDRYFLTAFALLVLIRFDFILRK